MGEILIINASPRAPRSNSKEYARIFSEQCRSGTEYAALTRTNHEELCRAVEAHSHVLFVFPLYADGIPVTLLNFLKSLEEYRPQHKPTVSVLINCGFLEPEQNDIAVEMMKLYCDTQGYPFGSVLKIGSGEAILASPFRMLVRRKIRALARAMESGKGSVLTVTMPLPKRIFVRASTSYWENYGKRNGITREQMAAMEIEK